MSSSNLRCWCNHMPLVHPLSKILCSINGCQRQYSVLRSYIKHIKQQHIAFWDTHWNISKVTTLSNDIRHNGSADMGVRKKSPRERSGVGSGLG